MPLSSLDKIRQIRKALGNPATGEVSDEDIGAYLHLAMKQLAVLHELPSLTTYEDIVTDGSTDYTMTATDVLCLIEPPSNETGGFPMELKTLRWDRQIGKYAGEGTPAWVIPVSIEIGEAIVRFRPVGSSDTIRIPYVQVPTEPGTDSTTENFSDLPEAFDMAEISLAATIGLELTNQREAAVSELQLGGMHQSVSSRSLPRNTNKYKLATAANRLLGGRRWKGRR